MLLLQHTLISGADLKLDWKAREGADFLQQHMQSILDQCRHDDLAAAMTRR